MGLQRHCAIDTRVEQYLDSCRVPRKPRGKATRRSRKLFRRRCLLAKLKVGLKPSTVALILQTRKRYGLTRPEVFVANGNDRSRSREARMADIFLSYASSDRAKAHLIAECLMARGHSVWWDRTIPPGRVFDEVIQEALDAAACILVLWSAASIRSNWVKTEASEALARDRLLPILIEDVAPPIEFKRIHAANLTGWTGDPDDPEFANLLSSLKRLLSRQHEPDLPGSAPAEHGVAKSVAKPSQSPSPTQQRRYTIFGTAAAAAAVLIVGALLFVPGPSRGQVNLLSPQNGGKLIRVPNASWEKIVDGDDESGYEVGRGEAVFGFKDDRSATFDTFTVYIPRTYSNNIKDFELLAGNESPTGRFESIGKFSTQNEQIMQLRDGSLQAHQEFHFAPVKAKYLKIRLLNAGPNTKQSTSLRSGYSESSIDFQSSPVERLKSRFS